MLLVGLFPSIPTIALLLLSYFIISPLVVLIDSKVQHNIKLNYSFDYVFSGQNAKQPTSHEISISYDLPVSLPLLPAKIGTPRSKY
jgi:hypothetical protein